MNIDLLSKGDRFCEKILETFDCFTTANREKVFNFMVGGIKVT